MIVPGHTAGPAAAVGTGVEAPRIADDARAFSSEAIEALPVGILLVGRDGIIARVNRESERLFGYSGSELIGHSVDILVPDAAGVASPSLRQAFDADSSARTPGAARECFARRKDGSEVAIEMATRPMQFRGTRFVLVSIVDVAAHRATPARLQAFDQRLEFEQLVGELGAEFGNLRAADVDRYIEEALSRLIRVLGVDRSALFQVEPQSGDFVHTHQVTRPGLAPPPPGSRRESDFPGSWRESATGSSPASPRSTSSPRRQTGRASGS